MAKFRQQDINLRIDQKELDKDKVQLTITIPGSSNGVIIEGAAFVLAMQNKIDMNSIEMNEFASKIKETVGEAQFQAFTNHYAMTVMTPFAISEKNIEPIMEPQFNTGMDILPGKDFTYTAIVSRKPKYELSSYEPVSVKIPDVSVSEQEIDAQLQNLAQRSATMEADKGAEVAPGSEIVFAIATKFKDNGEELTNLTAEKRVYSLGMGWLPEEFDKEIMGMKAGEARTFDFDLPGGNNLDGTEAGPRTVTTTVTLSQVNKKVIPAITDAWVEANMPEAKNVEGLREMMRQQGIEYKTQEQENMKFFLAASSLAERFQGTIPDEIYEFTSADMQQNLNEQLKQQGMSMEQYIQSMGMDQQSFNMQFMMQVRETLRQSFALDALARHLKLTVTSEDIEDTIKRMAPGNEDRARAEFEGSGRLYMLREAATRTKANQWLVENSTFEIMAQPGMQETAPAEATEEPEAKKEEQE